MLLHGGCLSGFRAVPWWFWCRHTWRGVSVPHPGQIDISGRWKTGKGVLLGFVVVWVVHSYIKEKHDWLCTVSSFAFGLGALESKYRTCVTPEGPEYGLLCCDDRLAGWLELLTTVWCFEYTPQREAELIVVWPASQDRSSLCLRRCGKAQRLAEICRIASFIAPAHRNLRPRSPRNHVEI